MNPFNQATVYKKTFGTLVLMAAFFVLPGKTSISNDLEKKGESSLFPLFLASANSGTYEILHGVCIADVPVIISQPADTTVCSGQVASFSVTANGALSYQWQEFISSWNDLTNAGVYAGAMGPVLSISNTTGLGGRQYRCILTGTSPPSDTSNAANLTVQTPFNLDYATMSLSVCEGENAAFYVHALGEVSSYQWQVSKGEGFSNLSDSIPYSGTSTALLTITGTSAPLNGYIYQCIVTGACNAPSFSGWDTLFVKTAPKIYLPPQDTAMCAGTTAVFAIQALGLGIQFQWQVDQGSGAGFVSLAEASPYSGTKTDSLTITGVTQPMDGYKYRCILAGTCRPADTSAAGTLYFNTPVLIFGQPDSAVVCAGGLTSFNIRATGNNLTYQWQVNQGGGFVNLTNTAPYSGVNTDSLNISVIASTLDGAIYRCLVANTCGPADTSASAMLRVNSAPAFSLQPVSATICAAGNASFTVGSNGTGLTYQWQMSTGTGFADIGDTSPYSGTSTPTLTITAAGASMNGYVYHCIVSGVCNGPDISNDAILHVGTPPVIYLPPQDTAMCAGTSAVFAIQALGLGIQFQWQMDQGSGAGFVTLAEASPYSGTKTDSLTITGVNQLMDGYKYRCILTGTCSPADTSAAGTLYFNTPVLIYGQPDKVVVCAGGQTGFNIRATGNNLTYQWQVNQGAGFVNLTNTAPYSGVNTDSLNVSGVASTLDGAIYRCIVSNACGAGDSSATAKLHVLMATTILLQPSDTTVCQNSNATFMLIAAGAFMSYQWQVDMGGGVFSNLSNTAPYSGVTSASLLVNGVDTTLNGAVYRCIVSGLCAPVDTSLKVTLHVVPAPKIIAQPVKATVCDQSNAFFLVVAAGAGLSYQWQVNSGSGFVNLTDNAVYAGTASTLLTLTGVDMAMNGNLYRVSLTGNCTVPVNSTPAMLSVGAIPLLASAPSDTSICAGIKVPARSFVSIPTGATIDWVNSNTQIGLSSGGKLATSVPSFVAQDTTRQMNSGMITILPQLAGCPGKTSSYMIHVNPLPDVGLNLNSLSPQCSSMTSVPLSGGNPAGGIYTGTGVSGGNFSPSTAGVGTFTITYTYTDSNSCASSSSAPIVVDICTGVNQVASGDLQIDIYPVPFEDKLIIVLNQDKNDVRVELFNDRGQVVSDQLFNGTTLELKTNTCASGIYYLRIVTSEGLTLRKIIKE